VDRRTIEVYEARSAEWVATRAARRLEEARALAGRARPGGLRADLGCGPGWHLAELGGRALGLDAAAAMLAEARRRAPAALLVRADLEALPFARGALAAAWARNSYVHVPSGRIPLALAELHAALEPDAPVSLELFGGGSEGGDRPDDAFAGRFFSFWEREELEDALLGAGFAVEAMERIERPERYPVWLVRARRARTLPDLVGPGMRLLVCGLNPSLVSADAGIPFFRAGNRFWRAALAAGLAARERDPLHALRERGLGFTDLVKRASARADELRPDEYRAGLARVERLVRWLEPRAVCFVGLAGFRSALDRRARAGVQPAALGGRPVYLMPSTSGAAAAVSLADLTRHLRAALALASSGQALSPSAAQPRRRASRSPRD
jgi:TDG/mug DNA glycosylase family protein